MARVQPEEVQGIVTTSLSPAALTTHIEAAHIVVSQLEGQSLSEAKLRLIELYLAAHIVYEDGLNSSVVNESIGDASRQFRTTKDSPYWTTAVALSGGLLLELSKRKASVRVYS